MLTSVHFDGQRYRLDESRQWPEQVPEKGWLWLDWEGEVGPELLRTMDALGLRHGGDWLARNEKIPAKYLHENELHWLVIRGLDAHSDDLDFDIIRIGMLFNEQVLLTIHEAQSVSIESMRAAVLSADPPNPRNTLEITLGISRRVFDRYLPILTDLETELDSLSEDMPNKSDDAVINDITNYRIRLKRLRRYATYHATAYQNLANDEHLHMTPYAQTRLTMVRESLERQQSLSQMFYDDCSDLIDGHISMASHRLNQIMKILTMFTVLFVPLSFIAGVYGMNFAHMPELQWRGAYFVVLGVMASVMFGGLLWFKHKKWF